jgi:hypothetical protein
MTEAVNPYQASKAVLIEVMNVLGLYRDHLVLIGGWVPELLLPGCGHPGSLDVDLAVDLRGIARQQYDTILQRLLAAGYERQPNCFTRSVKGASAPVKLDLITGEDQDPADESAARFQEIFLGRLHGVDLAFESFSEITIAGPMPDGASNTVRLRIATIEAFIPMKALAMSDRTNPKDAFDIYFCLKHFPGGVDELAALCRPLVKNRFVQEGMRVLGDKFAELNAVGPRWASEVAAENGADPELSRRDAFELMQWLLATIEK